MRKILRSFLLILVSCLYFKPQSSYAQVIPDQTLPSSSSVVNSPDRIEIRNGTRRGNNLFHSFRVFNILSDNLVQFQNNTQVKNIITRVTGNTSSSIDGSISLNGDANLFLLNKNGLSFGANARLEFSGSFLASTANSISFDNGFQFGSQNIAISENLPTTPPIQLSFSNNQSQIQVSGNGGFIDTTLVQSRLLPSALTEGLQTAPGSSLNVVGGEVLLDGGLLSASQGSTSIGAVRSGIVNIDNSNLQPVLRFSENSNFGNIRFANESLLDFSESFASVRGDLIDIGSGSILFSNNFDFTNEPSIRVTGDVIRIANSPLLPSTLSGQQQIDLSPGLSLFGADIQTGINTQSVGPAQGASIILSARNLELGLNAGIVSSSLRNGNGGDIQVSADDIVFEGLPVSFEPLISTNTFGLGSAGNVNIDAASISLSAGEVATVSFGPQDSGDIIVNTKTLLLENGSALTTNTLATSDFFDAGDAGDIEISATSIKLIGESRINFLPSNITTGCACLF